MSNGLPAVELVQQLYSSSPRQTHKGKVKSARDGRQKVAKAATCSLSGNWTFWPVGLHVALVGVLLAFAIFFLVGLLGLATDPR